MPQLLALFCSVFPVDTTRSHAVQDRTAAAAASSRRLVAGGDGDGEQGAGSSGGSPPKPSRSRAGGAKKTSAVSGFFATVSGVSRARKTLLRSVSKGRRETTNLMISKHAQPATQARRLVHQAHPFSNINTTRRSLSLSLSLTLSLSLSLSPSLPPSLSLSARGSHTRRPLLSYYSTTLREV